LSLALPEVWRFGQAMTLPFGDAQIEQLAHGKSSSKPCA